MKFAIIALLATSCSGVKITQKDPSPSLPTFPLEEFPKGSVNNLNYEHKFNEPKPDPDMRHCQEKVGIPGTLRNCKVDIYGQPINPGKI